MAIASALSIESSDSSIICKLGRPRPPATTYSGEFGFYSWGSDGLEYATRLFPQILQMLPVQLLESLTFRSTNDPEDMDAAPCIALLSGRPTLKTLSLSRFPRLLLHAFILTADSRTRLSPTPRVIDRQLPYQPGKIGPACLLSLVLYSRRTTIYLPTELPVYVPSNSRGSKQLTGRTHGSLLTRC
ncbi:hypothetical protein BOTBODRAFT_597043 [Botryobasidium botryosum FD-172 SS1]|uniref:Uncharacterized protein n=1 Tax=Botryobasidium botryosum (strain FD-172 SS1) TaxID=930990 RepID=A0A067M7K1_BOTB1|nr:hypothetical protein BOTBODRAFT_597043 [Botryobasidium botryosum FD-172 SS1]